MHAWLACMHACRRNVFDSSLTLHCLTHEVGSLDVVEVHVDEPETLDYSMIMCSYDSANVTLSANHLTRWHLKAHNLHVHTASTLATAAFLCSDH